ncbi:MAG: dihydroxyacetone kinase subunit DhaL [Caldilineaceae bacterium]
MTISKTQIINWISTYAQVIRDNKEMLTQLDAEIGDADHGVSMERGFQAVLQKLPTVADQDVGAIFKNVGMTLVSTVGGASGPLYGTLFMQMSMSAAGKQELSLDDFATAFETGVKGVMMRGKANLGEKTMIDSLLPAVDVLKAAASQNGSISVAIHDAERAAYKGMLDTVPLIARKGRASYLGERAIGHQDPGATSSYLLIKTASETLI